MRMNYQFKKKKKFAYNAEAHFQDFTVNSM